MQKRNPKRPRESKRITVRDIAEDVGLHFTTVAEALRGSRRIKESTRKEVEESAVRLGYRPDPILSALSAYRSSQLRGTFQGVIAWIHGFDEKEFRTSNHFFYGDCFEGARERAESLGFKLDSFKIGKDMSGERASEILKNRNILGVIIGPMPEIVSQHNLKLEYFNSVRIGYSFRDTRITNVISDQFQNTQLAYRKVRADKFQKIGFACPSYVDNRVANKFSGGFLSMVNRYDNTTKPCLFMGQGKEADRDGFLEWYFREKPDVILAGGRAIYYKFLREAGVRIPEDVQFVSLHAEKMPESIAGITQNGTAVGNVAVDHLVSMIQGFKVGIESIPKTTMILGSWIDGASYQPSLTS